MILCPDSDKPSRNSTGKASSARQALSDMGLVYVNNGRDIRMVLVTMFADSSLTSKQLCHTEVGRDVERSTHTSPQWIHRIQFGDAQGCNRAERCY
jgi:hypothetical protein